MANEVIKLANFQTRTLLELEDRAPGTYTIDLLIEGNSILSSLFVATTSGGSVKVNYWEDTTGESFGERKDLPSHPLISVAGTSPSKITVTPFHNKPHLEIIVSGGNVRFSIYATVVDSFATDLDAALIFDQQTFVQTENKAMPMAALDESDGKLYILRAKRGVLSSDPADAGTPFFYDGVVDSSSLPRLTQVDLATFTVAPSTTRVLNLIKVSCFRDGTWIAYEDSAIIGSGRTSAGQPDSHIEYIPRRVLAANTVFTLKYTTLGPASSDVSYHIMSTELGA